MTRANARARGVTAVVMTSAPDRVSRHAQQSQNEPDDHEDDAYGPEDRNFCDEPNDEQDDTKDNRSGSSHDSWLWTESPDCVQSRSNCTNYRRPARHILMTRSSAFRPLAYRVDRMTDGSRWPPDGQLGTLTDRHPSPPLIW